MSQDSTASGSPLSPGGRVVPTSRRAAGGSGLPPLTSPQLGVKLVVKFGWAPACAVEVAVNRLATPKRTGSLETGVGLVVGSLVLALAAPSAQAAPGTTYSLSAAYTTSCTGDIVCISSTYDWSGTATCASNCTGGGASARAAAACAGPTSSAAASGRHAAGSRTRRTRARLWSGDRSACGRHTDPGTAATPVELHNGLRGFADQGRQWQMAERRADVDTDHSLLCSCRRHAVAATDPAGNTERGVCPTEGVSLAEQLRAEPLGLAHRRRGALQPEPLPSHRIGSRRDSHLIAGTVFPDRPASSPRGLLRGADG